MINLTKGSTINLSKETNNGLSTVIVGLGWDVAGSNTDSTKKKGFFSKLFGSSTSTSNPPSIDCDASAIVCRNGHYCQNNDIVYFGNLHHSSKAINHMGDNLTGDGDGDDEQIKIDLDALPPDIDKIGIVVNIYGARGKGQHFGMIENAFVRIVDAKTNKEICRYSLSDNYSGCIAMIFGDLFKSNGDWQFNAVGKGTNDSSVNELANYYR